MLKIDHEHMPYFPAKTARYDMIW